MSAVLEDARFTVYEEKRDDVTSVNIRGLQWQSNIGNQSSNGVAKSPRLFIEHLNAHDKTIQTRTFLYRQYCIHSSYIWMLEYDI